MSERRRLLAGSVGPERLTARPDSRTARWYEPLHVRDERSARMRIADQVAVGADIVVAPTWLTHRRALLPLGETRQARAWTAAAVRVAREGLEAGLERREATPDASAEHEADVEAAAAGSDAGGIGAARGDEDAVDGRRDDALIDRPVPLVAAILPALDDEPEPDSGRLLPREAASDRDYRDQAGLIADAEPDLILVTGQRTEQEARTAIREACEVGLSVWTALERAAFRGDELEAWLEWAGEAGVACLLLPSGVPADFLAEVPLPWGGVAEGSSEVRHWLDMGATVIARLDGASADALAPLRRMLDDYERAELSAARAAGRDWQTHVAAAAAMAPGGAAAWLGRPPTEPLPAGFGWLVAPADQAPQLPRSHFRLVVLAAEPSSVPDAGDLIERGGILTAAGEVATRSEGLRLVARSEAGGVTLTTYRREE